MPDSIILQWLFARLGDLWSDTAGRIFLLTALSYFFSYLVYAGYLSRFSGGLGSLPFNVSDVSLTDLLSMFPLGYITLFELIVSIVKILLAPVLLLLGPAVVAAIAFAALQMPAISVSPFLLLVYSLLWMALAYIAGIKRYRIRSFRYLLFFILATAALFLFLGEARVLPTLAAAPAEPSPSQLSIMLSSAIDFGVELLVILILINVIIYPVVLGMIAADRAARKHLLSRVYRLTLKQPIPFPTNYKKISPRLQQKKEGGFLFARSTLHVSYDVFTYMYQPESLPLYLVASFRKITLFYVPSERKETLVKGRLFSISNDLVYSMELQKVASTEDP